MKSRDANNFAANQVEQQVDRLLYEFFRHHLPEKLPPLRWLDAAAMPASQEVSAPSPSMPPYSEWWPLGVTDSPAGRSTAAYWGRFLLLSAVVLLGWLLLFAPWGSPRPGLRFHLDPKEGMARDKPDSVPVVVPQPWAPSKR